jgi:hypothetical protein
LFVVLLFASEVSRVSTVSERIEEVEEEGEEVVVFVEESEKENLKFNPAMVVRVLFFL